MAAADLPIREPDSVRRLSRTFLKSLTAVDLAEPLWSLDETQPAKVASDLMQARNVPVIGVRRNGEVVGWVVASDLSKEFLAGCARPFGAEVIPEDAGFTVVLNILTGVGHVFVEWLGEVSGVITWRDLQKPPMRMWLFGAITVLDANLTWAVEELYSNDSWKNRITPGRLAKALALQTERERRESECRLIDCLQLKDKMDLLMREKAALAVIGVKSRNEADRLTRDIEKLRNHLAHSQEMDAGHFATAVRLASFIDSILHADGVRRIVSSHRLAAEKS